MMTFNNTFALATAAVFAINGRANDNECVNLHSKIENKLQASLSFETLNAGDTTRVTVDHKTNSIIIRKDDKGFTIENIF